MILSAIIPPDNFTTTASEYCIKKALYGNQQSPKIKLDDFLLRCSEEAIQYHKMKKQDFCYVTNLTYQELFPFKSITINTCRIIFKLDSKSKFFRSVKDSRQISKKQLEEKLNLKPISEQRLCIVKTKNRFRAEAYEEASDALDLFRGIVNLYINRSKWARISGGMPEPINELRLGNLHTLHNNYGSSIPESFWYDRNTAGNKMTIKKPEEIVKLKKFMKSALAATNGKLGKQAKIALIRYARALDNPDLISAFRDLWSVLELITDTSFNRYTVTIRRAANCHEDKKFISEMANHLRYRRNRLIHEQYGDEKDSETLLFQLNYLVMPVLGRLIWNRGKCINMPEFGQLLDIAKDKDKIDRDLKLLRSAKNYFTLQ
jgi:hypothetical protein